ncbi:adenylate/guanylate cyclase domain-containing protein [Halorhodospira halochloris]|uniref:adenylate/guanylate cyclase domain-containing protein n=1 Tax=Halorhodospira halochloris TaxID=1052 RepID=UPI001EE9363F|nr:adenylate/guanylate cyclase domain-containing protein [Halorhodospira halochloris]MCG5549044.1 adenylate/guanylate cyclase domain-containing protein [Halorhodospira halochloris]
MRDKLGVWKRWYALVLFLLVPLILVYLLSLYPPALAKALASTMNNNFFSFGAEKAPEEVVFVEIDSESVSEFGRWPWPRSLIAEGLHQLSKAKVIGLDMLFAEPSEESEDEKLAAAIEKQAIVGGVFLSGTPIQALNQKQYAAVVDSSLTRAQNASLYRGESLDPPIEKILEAYPLISSLDIVPDADQQLRRYPLAFGVRGSAFPSLGIQMWRWAEHQVVEISKGAASLGEQDIPIDDRSRVFLNYYPDRESYNRIPFVEIMEDDWDPTRVAGKWVIVGVSEAGLTDIRATPIGLLPGPLVHATFLANVLDDNLLAPVDGPELLVVLIVIAVVIVLAVNLLSLWLRFLTYIALAALIYSSGLALYVFSNMWLEVFYPLLFLTLGLVLAESWLFAKNQNETRYLRSAFSSYVAPRLVEQIVDRQSSLNLGGKRQQITVLFADLRNFTPTSEALSTEEVVGLLNAYFGEMIDCVQSHDGTLDKLLGDGLMALFNAPLADPNHEYNACRAAVAMQKALMKFNSQFPEGDLRRLTMGIGINTGEAIVGNIGAADRFNYTAIGDVVNSAARLEAATKGIAAGHGNGEPKFSGILIGERTYEAVKDRIATRYFDDLKVKGISKPIRTWELVVAT